MAKQNQNFPFHFFRLPTPTAEENKEGGKIFGFCPYESASAPEAQSERTIEFQATTRSAHAKLGILLEMGSDFFKQTPPGYKPRFKNASVLSFFFMQSTVIGMV